MAKHDHLGEFLVWPETPKRKGKRNTERFPFAITSEKYKLMFQNKLIAKRKAEEEKEERKRKREEKKEKPESKDSTAHNKQSQKLTQLPSKSELSIPKRRLFTNEETTSTNACYTCNRVTHLQDTIICDECKKLFHKKCIPKPHQVHVLESDKDEFLCHYCYKEESDSVVNSSEEELYRILIKLDYPS